MDFIFFIFYAVVLLPIPLFALITCFGLCYVVFKYLKGDN